MGASRIISLPDSSINGLWSPAPLQAASNKLLVCVHGGGYTHRFFDVLGASLIEAGNVVIVGHSIGGAVSIRTAVLNPGRMV